MKGEEREYNLDDGGGALQVDVVQQQRQHLNPKQNQLPNKD
jgi:hypothetical protein